MKIKYKYDPRLLFLSAFMMIVPPFILAAGNKVVVTILMIPFGIFFFLAFIAFYSISHFRIKQNKNVDLLNRMIKWFLVGSIIFVVATQLFFMPIFRGEMIALSQYSLMVLAVFSILQTAPLVWVLRNA